MFLASDLLEGALSFHVDHYSCAARHDELSTEDRSILGGIYARSCIAYFIKGDLKNAEIAGQYI